MTARHRAGLFSHPAFRAALAVLSLFCAAPSGCGGGGGGNFTPPVAANPAAPTTAAPTTPATSNSAAPANAVTNPNLTEANVNTIVLQAINEATARAKPATIAVVDRVGNVLAVAQMPGAPVSATITSGRGVTTGLENKALPTTLAATAKALTAAYLSSNGNAFTSRTANQIIQEHFNPRGCEDTGRALFGVSSANWRARISTPSPPRPRGAVNAGPHRSPAGFAADSGGLRCTRTVFLPARSGLSAGRPMGSTSTSSMSMSTTTKVIAIAGGFGFEAPASILASNIAVNGLSLRYTDASSANLAAVSAAGSLVPVPVGGYFAEPCSRPYRDRGPDIQE